MKKRLFHGVLLLLVLTMAGCTVAATLSITITPDPLVFRGPNDPVTGTIKLQIGLGRIDVTTIVVSMYEATNGAAGTEVFHKEFAINKQLPIAFGSYEFKLEDLELLGPDYTVQSLLDYNATDILDDYNEDLKGKVFKLKVTVNGAYTATQEAEIHFE